MTTTAKTLTTFTTAFNSAISCHLRIKKQKASVTKLSFFVLCLTSFPSTYSSTAESSPSASSSSSSSSSSTSTPTDVYAFTVDDVKGRQISLEKYRGKLTLIVNVASECGYTENHYHEMVEVKNIFKSESQFFSNVTFYF